MPHQDDDEMITGDELDAPVPTEGGGAYAYDDEETLVTKDGLRKLKDELEQLKNVRRKEVAQRLKEAISYGDLSENSEYEEAKNEQAFVEGRILELERKIKNARIISEGEGKHAGKKINIGSSVSVLNITDGDDDEITYTIVGSTEADPFEFRISNESPIGKALLNHSKGDRVSVQTPSGEIVYSITKVA